MEGAKSTIKRQVAYKVRIKDLINGKYIKNEGEWMPNYIEVGGKHISRVNLIGTIVLKSVERGLNYQSIILDDGTGKILIRIFEDIGIFDNVDMGEVVIVIGRPREFGSEKYIVPEILKKLNNHDWIKVRQLELEMDKDKEGIKIKKEPIAVPMAVVESSTEKIVNLIKEIDSGNGADIEEVVSNAGVKDAEQVIKKLLEEGEVFEVKSGKLKVLE